MNGADPVAISGLSLRVSPPALKTVLWSRSIFVTVLMNQPMTLLAISYAVSWVLMSSRIFAPDKTADDHEVPGHPWAPFQRFLTMTGIG